MRPSGGVAIAIRWGAAECNFNATESASARRNPLIYLAFRALSGLRIRVCSRTSAALVQARWRLGAPKSSDRRKGGAHLQSRRIVQPHAVASDGVARTHDAWHRRERHRIPARRTKKTPGGIAAG